MARNSTHIDAKPDVVWAVLEDPHAYPRWVVGTDRTTRADDSWPALGSTFDVHLGGGHEDITKVREVDPGRRIVLDAAAGRFGPARVTIELRAAGDGTKMTMTEDPAGKFAALRYFPPVHLAIRLRNVEALRRFKREVSNRVRNESLQRS